MPYTVIKIKTCGNYCERRSLNIVYLDMKVHEMLMCFGGGGCLIKCCGCIHVCLIFNFNFGMWYEVAVSDT